MDLTFQLRPTEDIDTKKTFPSYIFDPLLPTLRKINLIQTQLVDRNDDFVGLINKLDLVQDSGNVGLIKQLSRTMMWDHYGPLAWRASGTSVMGTLEEASEELQLFISGWLARMSRQLGVCSKRWRD